MTILNLVKKRKLLFENRKNCFSIKTIILDNNSARIKAYLVSIVLLVLVVPVLAANVVQANDTLAQEKIEVNVKIPVMQKVEVIDPVEITQEELNEVAETGQALVKENAGELKIISNTDWELQIQDQLNSDFRLYVRLSDDRQAEWINLADTDNNFFTGEQGRENVSFDLKVETVSQEGLADYSAEDSEMQLSYVLSG